MSLSLLCNASAIAAGGFKVPFEATGGVAPYTYSVMPDGAGGTIDPVTGLYTSSSATGVDEILVTDSDLIPSTFELAISVCTPIELVCDILQKQLGLGAGSVYLYNQKIFMPTDSGLYIAVGVLSCKPFANNRAYSSTISSLNQVQSTNFQATLSIDIYSRSILALNKKEEVLMALASQYAESQMELNSFYIAPITTSFVNLSQIDGAAILYRFNLAINIQYFSSSTSSVPFFDTFETPVVTTNS